jgi:hypothetical protein
MAVTARSWGALNARLNRLVREGVIAGFRTNLAARPGPGSLTVAVVPGVAAPAPPTGLSAASALRARIALTLADVAPDVAISIEDEQR